MDRLGSDMDNLAISSAVATDDLMVEVQTSSDDQAGSRPDRSMVEKSIEAGKDVQEVSTGKNIISADDAVDFSVQVAEVNEYRVCRSLMGTRSIFFADDKQYLHVRETTNIPAHRGPRPRIFVKGTKLVSDLGISDTSEKLTEPGPNRIHLRQYR